MTLVDKIRAKRAARDVEGKEKSGAGETQASEKKSLRQMLTQPQDKQKNEGEKQKEAEPNEPETIEEFFAMPENIEFLKSILMREKEKTIEATAERTEDTMSESTGAKTEEPPKKAKALLDLSKFTEEEQEEILLMIDEEKKKRDAKGQGLVNEEKQDEQPKQEEQEGQEKKAEILDLTILQKELERGRQQLGPTSKRTIAEMEKKITEIALQKGIPQENVGLLGVSLRNQTELSDQEVEDAIAAHVAQYPALQRSTKIPPVAGSRGGTYIPEVKYSELSESERADVFVKQLTQ